MNYPAFEQELRLTVRALRSCVVSTFDQIPTAVRDNQSKETKPEDSAITFFMTIQRTDGELGFEFEPPGN